ncbi:hypothetical protein MHM93_18715 [Pseudoalteromonas sp. MM17-2]|uniref:hypothetical protein n=1 Tax=Pseudoalteromonas TaxID=53246 RepID=UPI001243BF64|nr:MULTISPECIES: hypothetical protein [Pseudoalteromonas]MCG7546209.1 hypothetical protein [Pseudoalteromonas sp. MM17-2]
MTTMRISQSVGINGVNNPNDIKAVQQALNALLRLIAPTQRLVVDGRLGSRPEQSKTVAAINLFQQKVVGMVRPDGKVDVNGRTHRKVNEKLSQASASAQTPVSGALKVSLYRNIERYEGRVEHMYLDTKGFATVGVGHLLSNVDEAKKLPFIVNATGQPATAAQIEEEFSRLKKMPYGKDYPASIYKSATKLHLSEQTMDAQIEKHIRQFESELKRIYGADKFAAFPDNVKLALFDMIFNLGMTKLKNTFPNFNRYINAGDYKNAALESSRKDISEERNMYVRNLLANS